MTIRFLLLIFAWLLNGTVQGQNKPSSVGFILPAGFTIAEVAGPELANDIYCMTFSPEGHLVVSGRGYLKQLIDDNGDGVFDRAVTLADHPRDGAMGLLIEDESFFFIGDGGLREMPWRPGVFAPKSEQLIALKTGGEHDAHAITRGPDGWLYLLCGNTARVTEKYATLLDSPIKKPIAGCVLRISPDFVKSEIICDGFRNAYGFDWSLQGELYTFDSDNERCLGLPWYEGCRFYRIQRGGHYGWLSPQKAQFWRMPPYHPEVVAPILDLGRGSPTGVACYRHQQFPKPYQGAFFLLDWTFGVIYSVDIGEKPEKSTVFLKVAPGHGFAPTAVAVHPQTGDLFVTSGGRGTRGAVYRIRHEAGFQALRRDARMLPIPLSATSRTLHQPARHAPVSKSKLLSQFAGSGTSKEKLDALCQLISQLGEIGTASSEYAFKEGYQLIQRKGTTEDKETIRQLLVQLRLAFPSKDVALNREISRAMALLQDDSTESLEKLLRQMTSVSSPIDDLHYLFVAACCPARRTPEHTRGIVQALLELDAKYEKLKITRERNWGLRINEMVQALIDLDPQFPAAVLQHPDLGRPDHLFLVQDRRMPLNQFAAVWLKRIKKQPEYPWSVELVQLLSHGEPSEVLPIFRSKWDDLLLRDALLPTLAKAQDSQDASRLVAALSSVSSQSVKLALNALEAISLPVSKQLITELVACNRALQYWFKLDHSVVQALQSRLQKLSGTAGLREPKDWQQWIVEHYPEAKQQLESSDGVDRVKWDVRLKNINWAAGRMAEGEPIFKKHCAACHQGTSALGPDLAGIGKRFSHDDLITAIIQPSKDVPARYRTTIYTTHSGQTHTGLIIYEAVDGVILQTAAATIRIPGNDIAGSRTSELSLMPAGLMDGLTDQQITDLLAWLKR